MSDAGSAGEEAPREPEGAPAGVKIAGVPMVPPTERDAGEPLPAGHGAQLFDDDYEKGFSRLVLHLDGADMDRIESIAWEGFSVQVAVAGNDARARHTKRAVEQVMRGYVLTLRSAVIATDLAWREAKTMSAQATEKRLRILDALVMTLGVALVASLAFAIVKVGTWLVHLARVLAG